MQIISNVALISINETVIIQLISFLIFLFIINRVMIRPLQNVMSERESHVENIKLNITEVENDLEELGLQIQAEESAVRQSALEMKQELEQAGDAEAAGIFDATKKEIDGIREKADRQIEAQLSEARKSLQAEAENLAQNIMEKVLSRRLAHESRQ
jgi:F-type H+-transporting ATPase subunit b